MVPYDAILILALPSVGYNKLHHGLMKTTTA